MVKLVLLRHGQSIANAHNFYTGWNDVGLSEKGKLQALEAGKLLKNLTSFHPKFIHTSALSRAIITANVVAEVADFLYLPINKSWRLNERNYGALKGMKKDYSRKIFGKKQVEDWRRGFDAVPPNPKKPLSKPRYFLTDTRCLPPAESLRQAQKRVLSYYQEEIASRLLKNEDQLVVAHGSSLRVLIKKIEEISDAAVRDIVVPNALPIVYTMNINLDIIEKRSLN